MCELQIVRTLKLHISNTLRGRVLIRLCYLSLKLSFRYYFLLSLLFYCTSLDKILNPIVLEYIIQVFVFEYNHCVLNQLVEFIEQEPYLMLVKVMCQVKSQTILKNLKN